MNFSINRKMSLILHTIMLITLENTHSILPSSIRNQFYFLSKTILLDLYT